jgi:hypothetical protein
VGLLVFVIVLGDGQQLIAGKQLVNGHTEESGSGLQRVDIRIPSAGFPFGYGSAGHMERFCQRLLGQAFLFSEGMQFLVKFHTQCVSFAFDNAIVSQICRQINRQKKERYPGREATQKEVKRAYFFGCVLLKWTGVVWENTENA